MKEKSRKVRKFPKKKKRTNFQSTSTLVVKSENWREKECRILERKRVLIFMK